jgi:hypothetical protein
MPRSVLNPICQTLALLLAVLASPSLAAADAKACGPATPRHSRSEELDFPQTDRVSCHQDRTIVEDAAFFGGDFRSDTGHLVTQYVEGGEVRYTATLPGCAAKLQGTAKIAKGSLTAADGATRLAFTDGGVDLKVGSGPCAGSSEEFFFDHGGSTLAEANDEGSGCNLESNGIDKEAFIRFYYAFKRAVAKDDRKAVAGMVSYPLTAVGLKNRQIPLKRPADLVAHYAAVFPACMRQAVLSQRISRIFCRDQGVMFGDGEVWIAGVAEGRDGKPNAEPWPLAIITLGADACSLRH